MTQVLEMVEVHEELRIKHSVCHSCVNISHWDHSTLFSGNDGPRGEGNEIEARATMHSYESHEL